MGGKMEGQYSFDFHKVGRVITTVSKAKGAYILQQMSVAYIQLLQDAVIKWFSMNQRIFLWRNTENPFHVFVAEVLLRQTQSGRLTAPYLELISRYPSAEALASANVDELRIWFKPLGLIKRADNLIKAAAMIEADHEGKIPQDLDSLLSLPGIGLYSARAIQCLGFNKRVPMIDESSGRLLRRVLDMPPQGPAYCDQRLLKRATKLIPAQHSKEFNLGLLDLAAKYCQPLKMLCNDCPLRGYCSYFHHPDSRETPSQNSEPNFLKDNMT